MNKKKYIKKVFADQLNQGFQFEYLNQDNTIMKYCLKKAPIYIYFIEDYRHEFLSMKIMWNGAVSIINIDGVMCSSKVHCLNQPDMEQNLTEIYSSLQGRTRGNVSNKQFCELVNIYQKFLKKNNFFESFIFKDLTFQECISKCTN